uniref:Uncharacterized protein n=1 Tax=Panagrolaimus davidi TaxID=227884 RepID=A0A914P741_9BILA
MVLSIISIPRIFTFRFEVTQFTCLGLDRVLTTLLTNGYQRRIRNISFGITIGLSFFLAIADVVIFMIRDKFRQYSPQCGLGSGAGPYFVGYFFLLNFLCFSMVFACFLFHAYDSYSHPSSSSVTSRFLNQQVNNFLFIFIITFGLPTIFLTIYRLFHFDAFKSIINYTDASMQLQHVLIILSFLFCLNSKRKHLKQVSNTTNSTFTSVQPQPKNSIPLQPQITPILETNNLPGSVA